MDEQWSYAGSKNNQQRLWLAFHSPTRQVLAMHVGKRTRKDAKCLRGKLPEDLKKAIFYADKFSVYYEVVPWIRHRPVGKESGKTSYLKDLIIRSEKDVHDV